MRSVLLCLLCAALLPVDVVGQGSMVMISPGQAVDISADGTTVVGIAGGGFVWTDTSGATSIGGMEAFAVSGDGSVVCGTMQDGAGIEMPGIWTAVSGWTGLGGLPGQQPAGGSHGSGYDISADGSVAVGLAWLTSFKARGFRWESTTGMVELPQSGPNSSRASAVSGDGLLIGGWDEATNGSRRAVLWDSNGNQNFILATGGSLGAGEVNAINNTGSVAVGQTGQKAFRWTSNGAVLNLDKPAGATGSQSYWALGTSDDGSVIVGGGGSFFSGGMKAWIWTEGTGTITLENLVALLGVSIPPSAGPSPLENATGISADGRRICGWGSFPLSQSWVIDLPANAFDGRWVDLGQGLVGGHNQTPALSGEGLLLGGTPMTLSLSQAKPNTFATLVVGLFQLDAPFKGGVLVPTPDFLITGLPTGTSGGIDLPASLPAGLPSGISLFFQAWVPDPGAIHGLAASNGLQAILP